MCLRRWSIVGIAWLVAPGTGLRAFGADATGNKSAPAPSIYQTGVRPMIGEFCTGCHNAEKHKGGLNLTGLEDEAKASENLEIWSTVAERLRNHEMPPKTKPQPRDEQRELVLGWIDEHVAKTDVDCGKIATDQTQRYYHGHVMSRRLTRAEYQNTLRDLLGMDVFVADALPADGSGGEGFDTDGDTLFISAMSIQKYLQCADRVLKIVLPEGTAPTPEARAARRRLLVATPDGPLTAREAARKDIAEFVRRAFRRPVSDEEVAHFLSFYDRGALRGESFETSLRLALKAVLISPNFLFMVEAPPAGTTGIYRLDDYQLAARMACFLWSSMPDEPLEQLAETGRLHDPSVLRGQVHRMLRDPRSRALSENFGVEWLGISALGGAGRPDSKRFPDFDDELVSDLREEAICLFDAIIREDRSLLDLLSADYTFLNARLAAHYGIAGVSGRQMRKVMLGDHNRGGVLGLGAVLATSSYPLRTSPVLRGKWVLETILGEKMAPPPPTAGTLPPDDAQADGLSFRQRLERHRSQAECASCHQRMDPLGFGLENFDPTGRWRAQEAGGARIDASGQLPSGETFSGPRELREILLKRKDQFANNFCRKMLGYALGRGLGKFDDCVINDSLKALAAGDGRASVLIEQIVLSVPFQYRYAAK